MSYVTIKSRSPRLACRLFATIAAAALSASVPAHAQEADPRWKLVDEGLGRSGTTQPDGVRRYSLPRSDLQVELDGVKIEPSLALGSWLAFQPMGEHVMVMGDLVLTHEEVNPVLTELLQGGVKVSALHNHLLRSSPATMYLHVEGHGDPWTLSVALGKALSKSATPKNASPASETPELRIDTGLLDQAMGRQGKRAGTVYQYVVPRAETLTDSGMPVPETMGTGTVLNFQPLGGGKAAVTGDFVLTANEVDPTMKALRAANIEVTALHNHMLNDEPRLFFMHFWGTGDALALAQGLRIALEQTSTR